LVRRLTVGLRDQVHRNALHSPERFSRRLRRGASATVVRAGAGMHAPYGVRRARYRGSATAAMRPDGS
jgi:hypothetical protein